jgi:2-oxoisovalerate dehydrogenase E1 component
MAEAAEACRRAEGPFLVECLCYRHYHHAGDKPGSAFGYRSRQEEEMELGRDPVKTFPAALREAGLLQAAEVERIRADGERAVRQAVEYCLEGDQASPRPRASLWPALGTAAQGARSDGRELAGLEYRELEDFPRLAEIKYSDAIAAVSGRWLETHPQAVELGEEIANFGGGAYGATRGLAQRFPGRVLNTPISEAGFVGLGCGAAMRGLAVIVEVMFPDFSLVAADQLFNQIAKARHMYGGKTDLPLVVRTRVATGCGYGGQHSMDPSGLFALFPGWRMVAPANAFDYIGLFNTAMHSLDPVVILEHHSLYGLKFPVPEGELDYCVPFDKARRLAEGTDLTVLSYGGMTARLLALRPRLAERGVSAELIDLRTLDAPGIDYGTIGESLARTGALAIVEQAAASQGIGARLAAQITARFFDQLDAPPLCLASQDVPPPVSRVLEEAVLLGDAQILDGLEALARRR